MTSTREVFFFVKRIKPIMMNRGDKYCKMVAVEELPVLMAWKKVNILANKPKTANETNVKRSFQFLKTAKNSLLGKTIKPTASKIIPATVVLVAMNHIAGMFKFLATTCKTVPDTPQRADAQNANQNPRLRVFLASFFPSSMKKFLLKKANSNIIPVNKRF